MYRLRHYVLVYRENGTVALTVAQFGPFEECFFPVQMWNERGQWLRQPWHDQPDIVRKPRWGINADVWFVNLQDPPKHWFSWREVTEEQFKRITANPPAWWFDGEHVSLRPGHVMNTRRTAAVCIYQDYLKRSHVAYGGMPIYQVRHWSKKRPEDFPEILHAGLFHPWWKEPKPVEIHPSLCVRKVSLKDAQELTVSQRHRTQMALAVELEKQPQGIVVVPTEFIAGMGMS